jgi:isopentenyl diphosphate isomerase/L-lactate dehydrogenase-like FMN-dependent dehydrogenase
MLQPVNLFDYETLAQNRMPRPYWDFYQGGSDDELTLRANRSAFERLSLRPRVLVDVNTCDPRTSVLGIPVSMPILIAPTAGHGLAHADAECATAHAAGEAGTLMIASTESTCSLEEIAYAAHDTGVSLWFQLISQPSKRRNSWSLVLKPLATRPLCSLSICLA